MSAFISSTSIPRASNFKCSHFAFVSLPGIGAMCLQVLRLSRCLAFVPLDPGASPPFPGFIAVFGCFTTLPRTSPTPTIIAVRLHPASRRIFVPPNIVLLFFDYFVATSFERFRCTSILGVRICRFCDLIKRCMDSLDQNTLDMKTFLWSFLSVPAATPGTRPAGCF